jgi:hypothetical protein
MSIDTYGLPAEQYEEFFENNLKLAAKLFKRAYAIMDEAEIGYVDFKTALELFNDAIYAANDDCRKYQKTNNPEAIKDSDLFGLGPSREELMEEIQAVNAKVDALTAHVNELVAVATKGLTDLVD